MIIKIFEYIDIQQATLIFVIISFLLNIWLQIRINLLKGKIERDTFIHKHQFEKEYNLYEEIWKNVIELETRLLNFEKIYLSNPNPYTDNERAEYEKYKVLSELYNEIFKNNSDLKNNLHKNRPFYTKNIFNVIFKININVQKWLTSQVTEDDDLNFSIEKKFVNELRSHVVELENLIRTRILMHQPDNKRLLKKWFGKWIFRRY